MFTFLYHKLLRTTCTKFYHNRSGFVDCISRHILVCVFLVHSVYLHVLLLCRSSVAFVSACYVYVAVTMISLVLLQQLVLISQNLTLVEWRRASTRGWTHSWLPFRVPSKYNVNDRGFYRNWKDFLSNRRRQRYIPVSLPR